MKTIAIMRLQRYLEESSKLAKSYGYNVIAAPMLEVKKKEGSDFDVKEVDWVVFTSSNGVRFALEKANREFINTLNDCSIVAIGPRTKEELEKHGIRVDVMPTQHSSSGIVTTLAPHVKGKRVEIVRSTHGNRLLVQGLKRHDAFVHETQVYEITMPVGESQKQLIAAVLQDKIDVFTFTSSMIVRNFLEIAEDLGIKDKLIEKMNQNTVAAIGEPTAECLRAHGVEVDVLPKRFTFGDMLEELG